MVDYLNLLFFWIYVLTAPYSNLNSWTLYLKTLYRKIKDLCKLSFFFNRDGKVFLNNKLINIQNNDKIRRDIKQNILYSNNKFLFHLN